MLNIPIYRAKKIDSDEYVVGDLIKKGKWFFIAIQDTIDSNNAYDLLTFVDNGNIFEIDSSTLAIHFPDMIDGQGNKIFASLSEDGKGGDILEFVERKDYSDVINKVSSVVIKYTGINGMDYSFMLREKSKNYKKADTKVIGIQE